MSKTALACVLAVTLGSGCGAVSGTGTHNNNSSPQALNRKSTSPAPSPTPTPAPPPTSTNLALSTTSLPAAMVSVGYRTSLTTSGGTAPYRWRLLSGTLPAGLVLDGTSGVIVGVPELTASASLSVQVTDATGAAAIASLTLDVLPGSWGTAYYVDSVAGNDNNAGTSESTAWKTLARVNRASFAPGNQILLKRGDIWRETLRLPSSGVAGDPILVDAYGSGNAPVIDGSDLVAASAWMLCSSCQANVWEAAVPVQPNVVLFNGALGNKASSLSSLAASTVWFWSGGTLYVWSATNPGSDYTHPGVEAGSRQLGIGLFGISYVTVQNLEVIGANGRPSNGGVYAQASSLGKSTHDISFHDLTVLNGAGDGVHLEDCNNCIVQGATITGNARNGIESVSSHSAYPITSGAFLSNTVSNNAYDGIGTYGCAIGATCEGILESAGLFLSGIVVANNTVHDNGSGIYFRWTNNSSIFWNTTYHNTNTSIGGEVEGIELEASSNNTVEGNLIYGNSMSGLELSNDRGAGTTLTGSVGNTIAYNAAHDNGQAGLFTNATPTANNVFLYNVVWNHPNAACFLADGTGHQFYGNTCWNNSTGIDLYTSSTTPTTGSIILKNNIIANSIHQAVKVESGVTTSSLVFDHNDYYNSSGSVVFVWPNSSGSFATWQSKFAYDLHSMVANPQFASSAVSQPSDLSVSTTSVTIGAGQTLSPATSTGLNFESIWPSSVQLTQQGAAWNIGAFLVP